MKKRASIYEACIRSVLLYGTETWPITQKVENCIQTCDRRMLRYMADVFLQDRVPSAVVVERCGVGQVLDVVRSRRLRWFGHEERRVEGRVVESESMESHVFSWSRSRFSKLLESGVKVGFQNCWSQESESVFKTAGVRSQSRFFKTAGV